MSKTIDCATLKAALDASAGDTVTISCEDLANLLTYVSEWEAWHAEMRHTLTGLRS